MKKGRFFSVITAAALGAAPLMMLAAPAADASTGTVITVGEILNVRSGPGTSYSVIGSLAPGAAVSFQCYEHGTTVTGPYGPEDIWDQLDSGGFVSDAWVLTGSNNATAPECATSNPTPAPAPPAQSQSAPPPGAETPYNRTAAVSWAVANAQDPQGSGTLCTWFVSQALWAGGLPQAPDWQQSTYDATYVEGLVRYLRTNYSFTWTDITSDLTTNAVPQAQPGDIIVYSWNGNQTLDHMSFVVDIAPGQYPEVAEWGQLDFSSHPWYKITRPSSPYVKRGWTWSAMKGEWLQQEHPNMTAYLLHINGGYFTPSY